MKKIPHSFTWPAGQQWFYQGLDLLPKMARTWLAVWGLYLLLGLVLFQLNNVFLLLLVTLITPLVTAGLYHACHVAQQHENGGAGLEVADYFAPWKTHFSPLLSLGLVLLVMGFLTESLSQYIFGALGLVIDAEVVTPEVIKHAVIAQIISTFVSIPLLVVAFFSPQLVYFHNQALAEALKGSYLGFVAAWRALLVLSLILVALVMVIVFLGTLFVSFLGGLAVVILIGALLVVFSINMCAQFFAFDAIYPIHTPEDAQDATTDDFHTEI